MNINGGKVVIIKCCLKGKCQLLFLKSSFCIFENIIVKTKNGLHYFIKYVTVIRNNALEDFMCFNMSIIKLMKKEFLHSKNTL